MKKSVLIFILCIVCSLAFASKANDNVRCFKEFRVYESYSFNFVKFTGEEENFNSKFSVGPNVEVAAVDWKGLSFNPGLSYQTMDYKGETFNELYLSVKAKYSYDFNNSPFSLSGGVGYGQSFIFNRDRFGCYPAVDVDVALDYSIAKVFAVSAKLDYICSFQKGSSNHHLSMGLGFAVDFGGDR